MTEKLLTGTLSLNTNKGTLWTHITLQNAKLKKKKEGKKRMLPQ